MVKEYTHNEELMRKLTISDTTQQIDTLRHAIRGELDDEEKSAFGQFFTPYPIAELMASMFTYQAPVLRILDAGAGIGSLFTAAVTALCRKDNPPQHIMVTAYEIDDTLIEHLESAMYRCKEMCGEYRVNFTGVVKHEVFIKAGVTLLRKTKTLFSLVEKIIHEFAERYTPRGKVLYVGDTDEKFAYFDRAGLAQLGVHLESHGKMPDVIIHYTEKNWLILVEAVTSHRPIDGKRKDELERLFGNSSAGLVFVTAFLSRVAMLQYMKDIAWETDVWIAESPTHLIHFNGGRLLGPYKKK